ncbi:hypothetical protein GQ44DRAFT_626645 [Phaeosphaeriaceae sp. PMI808]|nr:hypothetical protein GQ44DRAFT_626645 [Phaeosphaeriaceae sp. PMI808]
MQTRLNLSPALTTLLDASHPGSQNILATTGIEKILSRVEQEARSKRLDRSVWLAVFTATSMTMASPESMTALFKYVAASETPHQQIETAEFMREIGMRCLGLIGIPRTINMLISFHASLPLCVASSLNTVPSRYTDASNIESMQKRGRILWDQVHNPWGASLEHKLQKAHPDLPIFIINNLYGGLFANTERSWGPKIGRIFTSLSAIASLRAQPSASPQLRGHIYGMRKVWEDGSWKSEPNIGPEEAVKWITSDQGCIWVLRKVDELVYALGAAQHSVARVNL